MHGWPGYEAHASYALMSDTLVVSNDVRYIILQHGSIYHGLRFSKPILITWNQDACLSLLEIMRRQQGYTVNTICL